MASISDISKPVQFLGIVVIAGIVTAGLLFYLVYALLKPELF